MEEEKKQVNPEAEKKEVEEVTVHVIIKGEPKTEEVI
jgi:hypothetical protein